MFRGDKENTNSPTGLSHRDRATGYVSYGLMLAAILIWITPLLAVAVAYYGRNHTMVPLMKGHFTLMIRTFWIALGMAAFTGAIQAFLVWLMDKEGSGFSASFVVLLLMSAMVIWFFARMAAGLMKLLQNKPIGRPTGW
jgi:uncharacterized membrane protein